MSKSDEMPQRADGVREWLEGADEKRKRRLAAEKKRQAGLREIQDRFQSVQVPKEGGGYTSQWRCRACCEVFAARDPAEHKCGTKAPRRTVGTKARRDEGT